MRKRYALDLDDVDGAIKAGVGRARQNGMRVTIAVVDDAGFLIQLMRVDEASPASVETATEKARASALTGMPTKLLEAMIEKRPALSALKRVAVEGGVSILFEGQRVGGIGVSGVLSDQDADIAQTVLEALTLVAP